MAKWHFWGEKEFSDVYENIYVRTFVEDWFNIVQAIAHELSGSKKILDIGCGEGHTTKQVLDRVDGNYECDLLEPDKNALINAEHFLKTENNIRNCFVNTLATFKPIRKYDAVFTSHTNYYWAFNEKDYQMQLDKLATLIQEKGKLLILTLPEKSDHYNIMLRQIYPTFNYSEYISAYYKKNGFKVKMKRFKMRMYIGDILSTKSSFDLKSFYRFIHNTDSYPSEADAKKFLEKIKKFQRKGYLDFKDDLIIVMKN